MTFPRLSVIVPVYNEQANLESSIPRLAEFLRVSRVTWELLVVDDGSRDATLKLLRQLRKRISGLRVIRLPRHRGKGAAVREGLHAARGQLIVFTDCDLSTAPGQIPKAVRWLQRGYDVAIGSRNLPGSHLPSPQPLPRRLAGRAFNLAAKILLGLPYADTQCGFKAFTARAARLLARSSRVNGFAFDVELLLLAKRFTLTVKEFPIVWSNKAQTTIRLLRHAPQMFGALMSLKRRFKATIAYHPVRAMPLILASCAGAVLGQIFYKQGALTLQDLPFGFEFLHAMVKSQSVWFGLVFFMASAVTWIMALARVELSFAFPMLSLNFVFTTLYAWLVFGEQIAFNRIAGISLVVVGVLAIAASGTSTPSSPSGGRESSMPRP